eukprot:TRINITY_DN9012_c0_g1_i3.p1 TRINITY_DN9012_c0_g1~~TRINITY_DN9012_c0_g1_i3.p1  ORF type:complete len:302 (-),score=82.82 TRINITY_DN9012_c0_g1_i3:113-1018(-)
MTSSSIVFKIKYGDDMRRVSFPSSPLYSSFSSTVCGLFPGLNGRPFAIKYTDPQDDVVTVGSEAEFKDAVALLQGMGPVRFVVIATQDASPAPVPTATTTTMAMDIATLRILRTVVRQLACRVRMHRQLKKAARGAMQGGRRAGPAGDQQAPAAPPCGPKMGKVMLRFGGRDHVAEPHPVQAPGHPGHAHHQPCAVPLELMRGPFGLMRQRKEHIPPAQDAPHLPRRHGSVCDGHDGPNVALHPRHVRPMFGPGPFILPFHPALHGPLPGRMHHRGGHHARGCKKAVFGPQINKEHAPHCV